ncbi:MAG TPA: TonB family protein [Lacunisphaera sp.]
MNIERYKWPVIIAASLHGALFLSITDITARDVDPPEKGGAMRPIPPVDPIEIPLDPEDRPSGEAGGPPSPLPSIPDVPELPNDRTTFTVPVSRYDPAINPVKTLVDHTGLVGGLGVGPGDLGATGIVGVTRLDRVPRAMVQPSPDYPTSLRHDGISGSVSVEFVVDTSGRVMRAEAIKWTHREFVEPAVRAVLRWRFEPGMLDGRKIRFRMVVPIEFSAER